MEKFILRALKPLVKLCLRRGMRSQAFFDLTKQAFVSVAKEELGEQAANISVSRLSAMTGLQRKDIKRLEHEEPDSDFTADLLMRIIGQWTGDKRYLDQQGKPRILSLAAPKNEFGRLVASISQDLSPYTALFELERLGAARKEDAGVRLLTSSLEVTGDQETGLRLLADDLGYFVSGVATNIFSTPPVPNLHARTEYNNIAPSAVPQIRQWILERGAAFHTELRGYLSKFDRDLNPTLDASPNKVTVTVGSFSEIQEQGNKKVSSENEAS